jgi:Ca2+-binding EF-hand superfamily protein
MGCSNSSPLEFDASFNPSWKSQFAVLQLTPYDVTKLQKIFRNIEDKYDRVSNVIIEKEAGTVRIDSFLDFIDLKTENTKFAQRIMSMFDIRRNGDMNFRDFVVSVWNYCTTGHNTLDLFAFDLYDSKENGYLDKEDIRILLCGKYA